MMEIRHAVHPDHAAGFGTEELRKHFLIEGLFVPGKPRLVYSHMDRLIVGGVLPVGPTTLDVDEAVIGAPTLLSRREMGIINVGGPGAVTVGGKTYPMAPHDGLFVGMGAGDLSFASDNAGEPAKFYLNSAPAHTSFPTTKVAFDEATPLALGEDKSCNRRTIRKYFHPDGVKSCQLVMGLTTLAEGSIWNTMPVHTHERRMEAYFYLDMPKDQIVFHFMGRPDETRHLVVRSEQAVLSPSWSIHSGAGTGCYSFIWGMCGENQTFTDMDGVPMSELK